jgi:ATP-dependent helicase/nuclease subunit A
VTDSPHAPEPVLDSPARRRISEDLDANLLVEAGAGSGKTTELVKRMVSLLASGRAQVSEIAAVTFTRKAAAELRERFQAELELRVRRGPGEAPQESIEALQEEERGRLALALGEVDQAFVGTIHAFCARLLRERPLDVGLDPGFEELAADERLRLRRQFWEGYLERLVREEDPVLEELAATGLSPSSLHHLYDVLVENPDVDFPADHVRPPSEAAISRVRKELERLVERGWELMPEAVPHPDWDGLQKKIRSLRFTREITGWKSAPGFFEALALICRDGPTRHRITQKRWKDNALAKAFCEEVNDFAVGDTEANRLLSGWYEHRYALVIRLAKRAAEDFWAYRRRAGRLDFQDLLVLTAELLRERPDARRELGARYRRLLVDEFQDTDPLQAEIMLLLASDPDSSGTSDWRDMVPRSGALFVVGDPKQSIYRFRRADIQLYQQVKDRFRVFGDVLELTTNFRSRPPVGRLVNELFAGNDYFPDDATAEQASFEPLNTRPVGEGQFSGGIFTYDVEPDSGSRDAIAEDDAARLASWIRQRVDEGPRRAGSFLILTRQRRSIEAYARALEAWGLPVQITGAGVGVEEELSELRVLLECMIDPTNPVKVVSALVGLFFGLDYEQLLEHRLSGGSFDAMRPGKEGDPEVLEGLRRLNIWWRASNAEAADVFVSRLVGEVGLLPFAAAGDLGSLRAGALVFVLDTVRSTTLAGEASLPGVLDALDAALALSEAEAPLEPGRPDAVRVMNLHQAKGLEAEVVVLADPSGEKSRRPTQHVRRDDLGAGRGYLKVIEPRRGRRGSTTLAQPSEWRKWEEAERKFEAAEDIRLLYVAVTRAREELWVARRADKPEKSPWQALDPWLEEGAERVELDRRTPPSPGALDESSVPDVAREVLHARTRLLDARAPGFSFVSVTAAAKESGPDQSSSRGEDPGSPVHAGGASSSRFRGFSWGSVVHGALAFAAEEHGGVELRDACRDLLVEHGRPVDDHGEPIELQELLTLVERVRGSEVWSRAADASRRLTEIPIALREGAKALRADRENTGGTPSPAVGGPRQLDLFGGSAPAVPSDHEMSASEGVAGEEALEAPSEAASEVLGSRVLEGVIDLVFQEPDGWVVVDYKTDLGTDPLFEKRLAGYRRQVDLYADAWGSLTGDPVKERILFFTTQGRVERW